MPEIVNSSGTNSGATFTTTTQPSTTASPMHNSNTNENNASSLNTIEDQTQSSNLKSSSTASLNSSLIPNKNDKQVNATRLPWGVVREKQTLNANANTSSNNSSVNNLSNYLANIEMKKPGEYLMHLIVFNFIQLGSKKLEQAVNGDKKVGLIKKKTH